VLIFIFLTIGRNVYNCRYILAFAVLTAANLALTLLAVALTIYIAPIAAGGGVPEVKAYLNGVDLPGFLGPKALFVKVCTYQAQLNSHERLRKSAAL